MPDGNNRAYFHARACNERALAARSTDAAKRRVHEMTATRYEALARSPRTPPILRGHEVSLPAQIEFRWGRE